MLIAFLKKIFGRSGPSRSRHRTLGIFSFEEVDLAQVRRKLKPHARGTETGAHDLPPAAATELDSFESQIAERFEAERETSRDRLFEQIRLYQERLGGHDVHSRIAFADAIAKNVAAQYLTTRKSRKDELHRIRADMLARFDELERFKLENKIRRTARTPPSRIYHYGIASVLLLIEIFLNGLFFARGSEYGLIGGWLWALIFASVNVVVGIFVGDIVWRNCNHPNSVRRSLSYIGAVLATILFALFNLFVAHFRDAIESNPAEAGKVAIQVIRESPFGLQELESWLLLALGFIFSQAASFDGLRLKDPFPGYTDVDTRFRLAEEDYRMGKEAVFEAIDQIKDEGIETLDASLQRLEVWKREIEAILDQRSRQVARYKAYLKHLEECCNELLQEYRNANVEARHSPTPAYFQRSWTFRVSEADSGLPAERSEVDKQILEELQRALPRVSSCKDLVFREHAQAVEDFRQIEDLNDPVRWRADGT